MTKFDTIHNDNASSTPDRKRCRLKRILCLLEF